MTNPTMYQVVIAGPPQTSWVDLGFRYDYWLEACSYARTWTENTGADTRVIEVGQYSDDDIAQGNFVSLAIYSGKVRANHSAHTPIGVLAAA